MTPRARRRKASFIVVPIALSALASMIFGIQPAVASELPRHERIPKAKATLQPSASPMERMRTLVSRDRAYSVGAGDTVSNIAARAGVSTAELLAANGLSWKTLIFIGQQLEIPVSTSGFSVPSMAPTLTRHRVVAGDTLEIIGQLYAVQPRALMTANGLDRSSRLIVGQRLVVPDADLMGTLPAESAA
jgi:LysM repeat protein